MGNSPRGARPEIIITLLSLMVNRALILLTLLISLASCLPLGENPEKRMSKYDHIMEGYGSDGYLYDFTKRSPSVYDDELSEPIVLPLSLAPALPRRFQRSPSNYPISGFGSDGYLYDFVN